MSCALAAIRRATVNENWTGRLINNYSSSPNGPCGRAQNQTELPETAQINDRKRNTHPTSFNTVVLLNTIWRNIPLWNEPTIGCHISQDKRWAWATCGQRLPKQRCNSGQPFCPWSLHRRVWTIFLLPVLRRSCSSLICGKSQCLETSSFPSPNTTVVFCKTQFSSHHSVCLLIYSYS